MKLLFCFGLIVLIGQVSSTLETNAKHQSALGKGFYLPGRNIIEDSFIGGVNIFEKALPPECIERTKPGSTGKISSDVTFYKDTKSFYNQIGASLGLSGSAASYFTLSGALEYVAGTESNYSVSGTSVNIKSTKEVMALSQNCINKQPLSTHLLEAFDRLPKTIAYPRAAVSWDAYATFLKSVGSHIATQVIYGSQLIQWEFSEASKDYSKKELTARACLSLLNGTGVPIDIGLDACSGFSNKDLEAAANVYTKSVLSVTGGSVDTQTKLRTKESRTEEAITQLLKEGKGDSAGAVSYKWKALYDILLQRFPDGDRNIKAKNLRMYYEGMKSYGCQLAEAGETTLREFVLNEKHGDPTDFQCRVPGEGCHADSDCHFVVGRIGCYCYGRSCIEKVATAMHGETREERKIRQTRSEGYNEGVNKSCYLKGHCRCDKKHLAPEWETVWSYGSIAKKGKVNSALKKYKASEKQQDDGKKEEGSAVSP